jgi:hypothetical protein
VGLIRNIWARKGVLERVRGVKFMWGGYLPATSCCTSVSAQVCLSIVLLLRSGTDESPWHVIG